MHFFDESGYFVLKSKGLDTVTMDIVCKTCGMAEKKHATYNYTRHVASLKTCDVLQTILVASSKTCIVLQTMYFATETKGL